MQHPFQARTGQYIFKMAHSFLVQLTGQVRVHLVWCPGHKDIAGNERADQLAKNCAANADFPWVFDAKGNLKKIAKTCLGTPPKRKTSICSNIKRHLHSLIFQLDSKHCALNNYLYRMKKRADPLCCHCRTKETVEHFLNHCPAFRSQRALLRKNLQKLRVGFNPNRLNLTLSNTQAEKALADFLESTKRFDL